jgi:hypothetical protein
MLIQCVCFKAMPVFLRAQTLGQFRLCDKGSDNDGHPLGCQPPK